MSGSIAEQAARLKSQKGIPADKIDEYKAAFDLFDPERQGVITVDKLARLLNDTFGQAYGGDDLKYMLQQFNDSGVVDFFAFASTLHEKMGDPRYNEAFGDAFDLFDTGKIGELSRDDLQSGMLKLGERLTDAEAEEMLKVAKKKDDFVRAMSNAVAATASSGGSASAGGGSGPAPAAAAAAGGAPSAGPARPAGGPARPGGGPGPAPGPARPPGGPGAAPGPSPTPARPAMPPRPGAPSAGPSPSGSTPRPPRPPAPPGAS